MASNLSPYIIVVGTLSMLMSVSFVAIFMLLGEKKKRKYANTLRQKNEQIAAFENQHALLKREIDVLQTNYFTQLNKHQTTVDNFLLHLLDIVKLLDRFALDADFITIYTDLMLEMKWIKYELIPGKKSDVLKAVADFVELHNKLMGTPVNVQIINDNANISYTFLFPIIRILKICSQANAIVTISNNLMVIIGDIPTLAKQEIKAIILAYSLDTSISIQLIEGETITQLSIA